MREQQVITFIKEQAHKLEGCTDSYDLPSLILLFSSFDNAFPDEGWDRTVHTYVLEMKNRLETTGIGRYSLFGGLAESCLALQNATRNKTRYVRFLNQLQAILIEGIDRVILPDIKEKTFKGVALDMEDYDLISGLTGIGIYLCRNAESPAMLSQLKEVLAVLIEWSKNRQVEGRLVPGWYLAPDQDARFRRGGFNLGVAHGVTGVLALLAIASLQGVLVEGQTEALLRIARWVQSKRCEEGGLFYWPSYVSFEEEIGEQPIQVPSSYRDSWCYGAPGIARTLFLAGKALNDPALIQFAEASFYSIFNRSELQRNLTSPMVCHGVSGLIMTTYYMAQEAKETKDPHLLKWIDKLQDEVLASEMPRVEETSIIEGLPGVLLTLLMLYKGQNYWNTPYLVH